MARDVGVKQQNWARWESDIVAPGAEMLAKICRVHKCSADWLLGLPKSAAQSAAQTAAQSAAPTFAEATAGRQTAAVPGEMPACSKCPYKKRWEKIAAMK